MAAAIPLEERTSVFQMMKNEFDINLFTKANERKSGDYMIYLIAGAILVLLMTSVMFIKLDGNRLDRQELQFQDFPSGHGELSILFISDIHRRRVSERLMAKMPKKPDLICIGGDLTERGVPLERIRRNIRRLGRRQGQSLWSSGNNDPECDLLKLKRLLKQENV